MNNLENQYKSDNITLHMSSYQSKFLIGSIYHNGRRKCHLVSGKLLPPIMSHVSIKVAPSRTGPTFGPWTSMPLSSIMMAFEGGTEIEKRIF